MRLKLTLLRDDADPCDIVVTTDSTATVEDVAREVHDADPRQLTAAPDEQVLSLAVAPPTQEGCFAAVRRQDRRRRPGVGLHRQGRVGRHGTGDRRSVADGGCGGRAAGRFCARRGCRVSCAPARW